MFVFMVIRPVKICKTAYRCLVGLPRDGCWLMFFQKDTFLGNLYNTVTGVASPNPDLTETSKLHT